MCISLLQTLPQYLFASFIGQTCQGEADRPLEGDHRSAGEAQSQSGVAQLFPFRICTSKYFSKNWKMR
jgi:hypothetical protein